MPVSPELYSKAKDLKETLYLSLRTVASGYVIMPDDYNVPYQIMRSLLLSVGQPIPIPDRVIRQGDYVYGQHVNDLKTICYALWNYINTALREPYINDSDFYPLRSLLDTIPLLMYGYLVTPKEWNAIFDYCRRMIDLILRYPPAPPYLYIWWKGNKLYSGLPPDDLYEIDETHPNTLMPRRINCCWYLYGLYWIVYFNPTAGAIYIRTSSDLKSWSSPKTVDTGCSSFEDSLLVNNYLYVVGIKDGKVYLYRVQLLSDGNISVTVMFNFGCTQYPANPIKRCDFSIRGNEMWFHYFVYISGFQTNIYRRVSYYPFNSVGSEVYVSLTQFPPDAIAMINGATHMFAFRQHHLRGVNYLYECHYDGSSWSGESVLGTMNFIFPFNWNNVTYAFKTRYDAYLFYWTGTGWSRIDYTDILSENGTVTPYSPVIWVESSDKLRGAVLQENPSTGMYRIRYFEIDSSLNLTLKEVTDWFTDAIYPYSVKDRANGL
jgi:hypothetical protein